MSGCTLGDWFVVWVLGRKHGELLLLKIQELHLREQILASCLSSLLTCVGP